MRRSRLSRRFSSFCSTLSFRTVAGPSNVVEEEDEGASSSSREGCVVPFGSCGTPTGERRMSRETRSGYRRAYTTLKYAPMNQGQLVSR
jgi:hypothetical protein